MRPPLTSATPFSRAPTGYGQRFEASARPLGAAGALLLALGALLWRLDRAPPINTVQVVVTSAPGAPSGWAGKAAQAEVIRQLRALRLNAGGEEMADAPAVVVTLRVRAGPAPDVLSGWRASAALHVDAPDLGVDDVLETSAMAFAENEVGGAQEAGIRLGQQAVRVLGRRLTPPKWSDQLLLRGLSSLGRFRRALDQVEAEGAAQTWAPEAGPAGAKIRRPAGLTLLPTAGLVEMERLEPDEVWLPGQMTPFLRAYHLEWASAERGQGLILRAQAAPGSPWRTCAWHPGDAAPDCESAVSPGDQPCSGGGKC